MGSDPKVGASCRIMNAQYDAWQNSEPPRGGGRRLSLNINRACRTCHPQSEPDVEAAWPAGATPEQLNPALKLQRTAA